MSAVVCGKRSSSFFEDLLYATLPPAPKRFRCSATDCRLSLSPSSSPSSPSDRSDSNNRNPDNSIPISHLRSLFPDIDPQLLERAFEASGFDLDSSIKNLNDFRLESAEGNLGSAASAITKSETGSGTKAQRGTISNSSEAEDLPSNGAEWVELLVREMTNASDVNDARARASMVLQLLEKSIAANATAQGTQNLHEELAMLKEQVEVLLRENTILKRAVGIQYERQKEFDARGQESMQLKQLVLRYQEQVRTLEVNNYALAMHLKQAHQHSSIPGRFHPDIL